MGFCVAITRNGLGSGNLLPPIDTWRSCMTSSSADEINRAPAKVQSALLEDMQERQVSIGGKRFPLPNPFLVMATQNPIEHEGVYPLPEAQRDRFLFKINVGYPTP